MSKVVGISLMRDEADICQIVVEHMLSQVDWVIVADNASVDGTREILGSLPITVMDDFEPAYFQSDKLSKMGQIAGGQGATWIVPFDADEILYSSWGRLGDILSALPPSVLVAQAELFDHVSTALDFTDPDPTTRMVWRRPEKTPLPKIACRYRPDLVIHAGNHGASYSSAAVSYPGVFTIRHFPYRSPEQMVRKVRNGAAAYALTDLPEMTGAHWRQYGRFLEIGGEEAIHSIYQEWFFSKNPSEDGLILDPAPVVRTVRS